MKRTRPHRVERAVEDDSLLEADTPPKYALGWTPRISLEESNPRVHRLDGSEDHANRPMKGRGKVSISYGSARQARDG
jgi:hypothetical protein